jgi:hypothetical protein
VIRAVAVNPGEASRRRKAWFMGVSVISRQLSVTSDR